MTNDLSVIKSQVKALYEKKQTVHIDMSQRNKNKNLTNVSAEITGVYPNVFTLKTVGTTKETSYNFQYADLLIHNLEIKELN